MVRRGRGILRFLPGPPQTGSVRRFGSGLLLSQFSFLRRQIDFLFRADNLFAIDGHDLEARHLIALEPHEINFFRRSAVYPFFVVLPFVILVANLAWGAALGESHHFLVHANQDLVIFNRFLDFRGQRLLISFGSGQGLEVNYRRKQLAYLIPCELRHVLVKFERDGGAVGVKALRTGATRDRRSSGIAQDLNVLIPLLVLLRSAINFEDDALILDQNVGDHAPVARTNRWAELCDFLRNYGVAGTHYAILNL